MSENNVEFYEDGNEPVVYHYEKGSFRKREEKRISDMATGVTGPEKGFFKVLVNTKGNKIMFFTMIVVFAMVMIWNFVALKSNEQSVNGAFCTLEAFSYDGKIYSSLNASVSGKGKWFDKNSGTFEPCLLEAEFSFVDSDGDVIDTKEGMLYFTGENDEDPFIRATATDFNIEKVKCVVSSGNERVELTVKVTHR